MRDPSHTLTHTLSLTYALSLSLSHTQKLPPGTRVSIWATQKMRPQRSGSLQPVSCQRSLVATLVSAHRESVDTSLYFRNSTLLSFSISPQSHSCAVHLAGYFDHSEDKKPEQTDDGSITWAELQELLANARGGNGHGDDDGDGGASALEEMRRQIVRAQEEDEDDEDDKDDEDDAPEEQAPAPPKTLGDTASTQGGALGKRKSESAGNGVLDAKKQAALSKVRVAAAENEAKFAAGENHDEKIASPIFKHPKGRTRKLAGGTQVADISAGAGKLICVGSNVSVTLTEQNSKGKSIGEATKVSFVVGLKKVPSGLDRAVVGMRVGAKALVCMQAAGNDKALPPFALEQPLSLEMTVDNVA